ncbi:MAG TPA: ankyrin repeat domain-containing protein [Fimbriimonas sp.]|nr:ankyrin repeat domain-containing protein [Fimbriimonas sp.]
MSRSVDRLDLRQLKVQAKELVRAVRSGNADALARVAPYFGNEPEFFISHAQLVLARENGFESWTRLREELQLAPAKSLGDHFFQALLAKDDDRAVELVRQNPELAGIWRRKEYGWVSVLSSAAELGRLEPVKALVEAGADVYPVNQGGYPPVFEAASGGHAEVAEYLMQASAVRDSGLPPTYGCGIDIVLAARLGMTGRLRMHVERDPLAVFRRGCIGETVLHWPAHNGHVESLRYLLEHGALIEGDEIGLYGGKPLHWASEHAPECVELLLAGGADPNSRNLMKNDFEGFTPLHMMASQRNQCIECAELLLRAGADKSLLDAKGRTPLQVAAQGGRDRVVSFLSSG